MSNNKTRENVIEILINSSLIGHAYQRREEFEKLADEIIAVLEPDAQGQVNELRDEWKGRDNLGGKK